MNKNFIYYIIGLSGIIFIVIAVLLLGKALSERTLVCTGYRCDSHSSNLHANVSDDTVYIELNRTQILIRNNSKKPVFLVYDAMLYKNKPDLAAYGLKRDWIVYSTSLWPKGTSFRNPDALNPNQDYARNAAIDSIDKSYNDLVQLDIEDWQTDDRLVSKVQVNRSIMKMRQEIAWFKSEAPQLKIGYYSMLPVNPYWDEPMDNATLKSWMAADDNLVPLVQDVDALFPSLYTYYKDSAGWVSFARAYIKEAKRIGGGKPVYALVWPQYHDKSDYNGEYIDYAFWKLQLQTIRDSGADGIIIWGSSGSQWDQNQGWWNATKDFMKELNNTRS